MKTKIFQMSSGESYSILLGEDGMPMPYQNLFVTLYYRNQSRAANTCHRAFECLSFLDEICQFEKIDLIERCKAGDFLTENECRKLKKHSGLKVETFREMVVRHKSANVVTFNKNKLESARGEFDYPESNISPFSTYNRLTVFANYIGWLEKELFPSKESTTELELKTIRGDKFGKNSEIVDWGNDRALEDHQVMRLLDVVHPDSKENPWKSEAVRWRNYLIVNLMFAVGCRRGELLKIRVGTDNYPPDIKKREKNGRYFVLLRANRDDGKGGAKPDQRKYRPEGKTKTRLVPLDKRMVEIYENYLIHHRPKATGSEHIEYLFITHGDTTQCRALSISAMQKIFTEISKVLKFKVQTHTGRHTWNEKFSKYADGRIADGKTTEAKSEADRRKLMGWSEDSSMARLYAKRHDNERAWNMGVELQEEDSTTINSIVQKRDEDLWTDGE